MDIISSLLGDATERSQALGRAVVTLSYAQSLDGSLTTRRGERLNLSCEETKLLTHRLRAAHDAILVGIGTVLADNPKLTARLVGGPHPLPVVLDRRLRIPMDSEIIQRTDLIPWVVCGEDAPAKEAGRLMDLGIEVLPVGVDEQGRLDLRIVLEALEFNGYRSLMVEGGARVIASFLDARLVDQAVITIAPVWVGGLKAVENTTQKGGLFPSLLEAHYDVMGRDLVVWGRCGEEAYAEEDAVFYRPEAD